MAGDNADGDVYIFGDNRTEPFLGFINAGEYGRERDFLEDGDDVIYGGDNGAGDLYMVGGYGDDKIFSGNDTRGDYVIAFGDQPESVTAPYDLPDGSDWSEFRGAPGDGDDLIRMGNHPDVVVGVYGYGNGGNDKIFGGIG